MEPALLRLLPWQAAFYRFLEGLQAGLPLVILLRYECIYQDYEGNQQSQLRIPWPHPVLLHP